MKALHALALTVVTLTFVVVGLDGCREPVSEESSTINAPVFDFDNRKPTADFDTGTDPLWVRTTGVFRSRSYDPEGRIDGLGWVVTGPGLGRRVLEGWAPHLTFPETGTYEVQHWVRDEQYRVEVTKAIRVLPPPRVIVRLCGIEFGPHVGDGTGEAGEVYVICVSTTTSLAAETRTASNVFPGPPDTADPWRGVAPHSRLNFGPHSGLILYEGAVDEVLGISIVVMDHDSPGFDYGGLFSVVFQVAGGITSTFAPVAGAVLTGLGKVSSYVGDQVQSTGDDLIGTCIQAHTPLDRWGTGTIQRVPLTGSGGGYAYYLVEAMPQ